MPQLIHQEQVQVEWEDVALQIRHDRPVINRSKGVHLSGIVRYMAMAGGVLTGVDSSGKWKGDTLEEEEMPLRMAMGMAWEEWVAGLYPDMNWQPGELERDGIIGSPDGLSIIDRNTVGMNPIADGDLLVEEFKLTWKKRVEILDQWMWMKQGAGYCAMISTNYCRFHVCWVNGSYHPPSPEYYRYLLYFSDKELEAGWKLMVKYKSRAKAEE